MSSTAVQRNLSLLTLLLLSDLVEAGTQTVDQASKMLIQLTLGVEKPGGKQPFLKSPPSTNHRVSTMKLLAIICAAWMATISAQVPDCDLGKLMAVGRGPTGAKCQAETGFTASPGTIATGDKLLTICTNANCMKLLGELTAANPTECLFSGIPIKSGIIGKYTAACAEALGGAAPAASNTPSKESGSSNSTKGDAASVATTAPGVSTPTTKSGAVAVVASAGAVAATAFALLL